MAIPIRRLARPQALVNPTADSALRTDGLAPIGDRLLDDAGCRHLRNFFKDRFPGTRGGFHNDFFLPNTEFRLAATLEMAPLLYEPTVALFEGYTPFLYTFLAKFPGDNSALGIHRDWMYIDERRGDRSFILYIALEDQMAENGAIRFLPRSHRLHGPLCGTRLIWPWLMNRNVIRDRQLELPLRAGEAAVWDNSLIHSSGPNSSGELRLAVGVWFRPVEVGLAHFSRDGDHHAVRYGVDECFFTSETPFTLLERAPAWPIIERISLVHVDTTAATMESVLDHRQPTRLGWAADLGAKSR